MPETAKNKQSTFAVNQSSFVSIELPSSNVEIAQADSVRDEVGHATTRQTDQVARSGRSVGQQSEDQIHLPTHESDSQTSAAHVPDTPFLKRPQSKRKLDEAKREQERNVVSPDEYDQDDPVEHSRGMNQQQLVFECRICSERYEM